MGVVKIKGMSCQHCVGSVKEAMEKIEGVENVSVNLESGEARFDGDVDYVKIEAAISGIGFETEKQ